MARGRLIIVFLCGFLALALVPQPAAAEAGQAVEEWCAWDDPATYFRAWSEAQLADDGNAGKPVACPAVAAQPGYPDRFYLPMPCGRVMPFVKVRVPSETILDHVTAPFGSVSEEGGIPIILGRGPWDAKVSGAFTETKAGEPFVAREQPIAQRSFYIAAYEVSDLQYKMLEQGVFAVDPPAASAEDPRCAPTTARYLATKKGLVLPSVGHSWFTAIEFARAYGNWLLALDRREIAAGRRPWLPWEQGSPGYVRLPTDAEWEYAARGGAGHIGQAERARTLYLVRDPDSGELREARDAAEIASYGGNLNYEIGLKLPNTLGLYDMVGSAEEIVLDPFHMTRPDGLQGQAGGMVLRGGVPNSENLIGVGMRREVPLFDLSGETHVETAGFRLAIAAPVFSWGVSADARWQTGYLNTAKYGAMEDAREGLVTAEGVPDQSARQAINEELDNLLHSLGADSDALPGSTLKDRLTVISQKFAQSTAELQIATRAFVRERVRAALMTNFSIRTIGRQIYAALQNISEFKTNLQALPENHPRRLLLEQRLAHADTGLRDLARYQNANFGFYVDLVIDLSKRDEESVVNAAEAVADLLSGNELTLFVQFQELLLEHIDAARRSHGVVSAKQAQGWLRQIDVVRQRRQEQFRELIASMGFKEI